MIPKEFIIFILLSCMLNSLNGFYMHTKNGLTTNENTTLIDKLTIRYLDDDQSTKFPDEFFVDLNSISEESILFVKIPHDSPSHPIQSDSVYTVGKNQQVNKIDLNSNEVKFNFFLFKT